MSADSNTSAAAESTAPSDWAIVQRVQGGETDSFEILVRRHQKAVFNLAIRMLRGDYDKATDVAQEVFLSAFRSIGQFRGEAKFSTWLFRITLNHAKTQREKLVSQQRVTTPLDDTDPVDDRFPDPVRFVELRQTQSLVQKALNKVSAEHCEIVELIDMQGVSYEEAADIIGIKIETVKTRLHRARQALRAHLAPVFKDRGSR